VAEALAGAGPVAWQYAEAHGLAPVDRSGIHLDRWSYIPHADGLWAARSHLTMADVYPGGGYCDRYPVTQVSEEVVRQSLRWLGLELDRDVRLPTRTEWEALAGPVPTCPVCPGPRTAPILRCDACRHGDYVEHFAWLSTNAADGQVRPMRAKWPNAAGLYDVWGNVWEPCTDHGRTVYCGGSVRTQPQQDGSYATRQRPQLVGIRPVFSA
jgi:formylglycine-generating enzyme required for sulfatase activity